jgi:hypothetical protein
MPVEITNRENKGYKEKKTHQTKQEQGRAQNSTKLEILRNAFAKARKEGFKKTQL